MAVTFEVGDFAKQEMVAVLREYLLKVGGARSTTTLGDSYYYPNEASSQDYPIEIKTTVSTAKFESTNSFQTNDALILPIIQGMGMKEIVLGKFDGTDDKIYGKAIINKSNPNNDDVVLINKIEVNITGG